MPNKKAAQRVLPGPKPPIADAAAARDRAALKRLREAADALLSREQTRRDADMVDKLMAETGRERKGLK